MRRRRSGKKFQDTLPEHIGNSIEQDLRSLVSSYGTCGSKGAYLSEQCFSKYCDERLTPASVRRRAAIEKWLSTEARNALTNQRLLLAEDELDFGWTTWGKLRDKVRSIVRNVLGPVKYPDVLYSGNHTNGASTRIRRSPKAAVDKLTGEAHCSKTALQHWVVVAEGSRLQSQTVAFVEESVLFTVPKSTSIDRVACKEPEINMFLQRSVGNHIRLQLRRSGIDLNDQSRNQSLAANAVKRKLATIDLSSASDSISKQLVINLLPFEWWSLLDDLRVKGTLIDGELHELEMFSSMGNGFTFELESLLFYAVTRAVCWLSGLKGVVSVFGDDIIAPSRVVPRLKRIFDFLGFKMNLKKSFWRGPLRESCGGHYWNGVDISPFYLRGPVRKLTDLIRLLNQILEWDGRGWGFFTSPEFASFHRKWAQLVPSCLHGGQDCERIDSLVTGDPPRKRIMWKKDSIEFDQEAGLTSWFLNRQLSDIPIAIDPLRESRPFIGRQPEWLERTTFDPYLVYTGME